MYIKICQLPICPLCCLSSFCSGINEASAQPGPSGSSVRLLGTPGTLPPAGQSEHLLRELLDLCLQLDSLDPPEHLLVDSRKLLDPCLQLDGLEPLEHLLVESQELLDPCFQLDSVDPPDPCLQPNSLVPYISLEPLDLGSWDPFPSVEVLL